ncbi:hypothetical protein RJT34_02271 [Clitoria ternatea]|uniref:Uncharacterized protein n=1 Tax=Clitoria ternatea TaxID=43366 RepID=A0AAN9KHY0_CLITE
MMSPLVSHKYEELAGQEVAATADTLGPQLLPEPPRASRLPTLEYICFPQAELMAVIVSDMEVEVQSFTYGETEDLTTMMIKARDLLAAACDAYHRHHPCTTQLSTSTATSQSPQADDA